MQPSLRAIYAGTYTERTQSRGVYAFRFQPDGSVESLGCVAIAVNPSFLLPDPHKPMIYAVEETLGGSSREGAILAYHVDLSTGGLELVNRISSGGVGPCFLALAKTRRSLLFANYHDGSIGSIRLKDDGSLASRISLVSLSGASIHPQRQTASHPHAIVTCSGDSYAIVADLGSDRLHVFELSPDGEFSEAPIMTRAVTPGSGPRHLVIHPSGRFLYAIHEISSAISLHRIDTRNWISPALQVIPAAAPCEPEVLDAADIVIDHSGGKLYTCTRRTNTIRSFTIDPRSGQLTHQIDVGAEGLSPHSLCLDPSGRWLASSNHLSNCVTIFDPSQPKGPALIHTLEVPGASCTAFL